LPLISNATHPGEAAMLVAIPKPHRQGGQNVPPYVDRFQEEIMLQKYKMQIDAKNNQLTIREFAFIGKQKHLHDAIRPKSDDFLMAHKVTYDLEAVSKALSAGKYALIDEIRTDVFFPAETCAERIADQIIDLLANGAGRPVELFFDDRDILADAESIG
jgi:hypothetical protein